MKLGMREKRIASSAILTIITIAACLIILIPLMIVVLGSFKDSAQAQKFALALPAEWHIDNYSHVLVKGKIGQAFRNSMFITVSVTAIVVIAGSLSAFVTSRKQTRYTQFVYYLFLIGMVAPIQIVTTYALLQFLKLSGTFIGVILVETALQMPWTIFTMSGFIKNVPRELDEAAFIQ